MAAQIRQLKTKPQAAQEEAKGQLLLALEGFDHHRRGRVADLVSKLRQELRREASSTCPEWTFVMISPAQHKAVVHWLKENAKSPMVAILVWAELFDHLDNSTGEILASRAELAEAAGTNPDEVSRVMSDLSKVGAVIRRRVPANGSVRYFMNPLVGTHLRKDARELAQEKAPKLKLVEPA